MGNNTANKYINGEPVHHVHSSKDNKVHQLSLTIEQKIRNEILMPDYEVTQKESSRFGDVVYCSKHLGIKVMHWFESTYEISESDSGRKLGKGWHEYKVQINNVNITNLLSNHKDNISTHYIFAYGYKFKAISRGISCFNINGEYGDVFKYVEVHKHIDNNNKLTTSVINIDDSKDGYSFYILVNENETGITDIEQFKNFANAHLSCYCKIETPQNKIMFSKKHCWYIIANNSECVCVKKGKNKFSDGNISAWGIANKWNYTTVSNENTEKIKNILIYWGYTHDRKGGTITNGYPRKNIIYHGWHICRNSSKQPSPTIPSSLQRLNIKIRKHEKDRNYKPYWFKTVRFKETDTAPIMYKEYKNGGKKSVYVKVLTPEEYYSIRRWKQLRYINNNRKEK